MSFYLGDESISVTFEEVVRFIVSYLKDQATLHNSCTRQNLITTFLTVKTVAGDRTLLNPIFSDALWLLSTKNILRPTDLDEGGYGGHYVLTGYGKARVAQMSAEEIQPLLPV